MYDARSISSRRVSWLPPHIHGQVELPVRGEWRQVNEPVQVRRAEVVELRVEAPVIRQLEEVAGLERDPQRPRAQPRRPLVRRVVGEREVTQGDVRRAFEVRSDVIAATPRPVAIRTLRVWQVERVSPQDHSIGRGDAGY